MIRMKVLIQIEVEFSPQLESKSIHTSPVMSVLAGDTSFSGRIVDIIQSIVSLCYNPPCISYYRSDYNCENVELLVFLSFWMFRKSCFASFASMRFRKV